MNCAGSGSKGFDARTEENAARSSGSFPELRWITGSSEGTLTDEDVAPVRASIVDALATRFGAVLRA